MTSENLIGILVAFVTLWLAADLKLYMANRQTVSQLVVSLSERYPFIPWLIGILMGLLAGHLFA